MPRLAEHDPELTEQWAYGNEDSPISTVSIAYGRVEIEEEAVAAESVDDYITIPLTPDGKREINFYSSDKDLFEFFHFNLVSDQSSPYYSPALAGSYAETGFDPFLSGLQAQLGSRLFPEETGRNAAQEEVDRVIRQRGIRLEQTLFRSSPEAAQRVSREYFLPYAQDSQYSNLTTEWISPSEYQRRREIQVEIEKQEREERGETRPIVGETEDQVLVRETRDLLGAGLSFGEADELALAEKPVNESMILPIAVIVLYKSGNQYGWDAEVVGHQTISHMLTLSLSGSGLNAFIQENLRGSYSFKLLE